MKRLFAILVVVFLPLVAQAQTWPEHENTFINDFADVIDEDTETRLKARLQALRDDKGVEAVVVTLPSRAPYQGEGSEGTLSEFGIGLINNWGVGDAEKNDGIMVLVLTDDREMTVELGAAYDKSQSLAAMDIIDTVFTPAFKDGNYSAGIEDGTNAILAEIAGFPLPEAAPEPAPATSTPTATPASDTAEDGGIGKWILGLFGGLFAAGIGWGIFGRKIKDSVAVCPSCGEKGMHTERKVLQEATEDAEGLGEETVTCNNCDYKKVTEFTIAKKPPPEKKEEFSGGKSDGGGASGKW